jgi:L-lactate utilization protein LutB
MARERAGFPDQARVALANPQLRRNLGKATSTIRAKRARVVGELPDWEALRQAGAAIKEETLTHLDRYLIQLEASVREAGGQVHWAEDARMANQIIVELVQATGAKRVVKVKSLTSDEILLNEALAVAGVTAVETDLALPPHDRRWAGSVRRAAGARGRGSNLSPPPILEHTGGDLRGELRRGRDWYYLRRGIRR